jgi:hypothetical protein
MNIVNRIAVKGKLTLFLGIATAAALFTADHCLSATVRILHLEVSVTWLH